MSTRLRKKRANTVVWVILALVILGIGGFGAQNFGGSVRSIGAVGETDVGVNDYARALRREIQTISTQLGQPLAFQQAQALGVDQSVQGQVFAAAALDEAARTAGLSVGDAEVRRRLGAIEGFKGLDGAFDREAYRLVLQQNGLDEAGFEAQLRAESARGLLESAVARGVAAPPAYADTLTAWAAETRSFTLAELIASDLAEPVPAPDDAALRAYYDAHPDDFTRPETRRITYAWLSPDMLLPEVQLDEAALRAAYEDRLEEFVTPERRLVERLIFPDTDAAEAAKARLASGAATFADLAEERGLTLADADLGEVAEADLGAAGPEVFALTAPGIVGPVETDLGPALFSMNAILERQEVGFEDAREELSSEVAMDRARRMVLDMTDELEDLIASGVSLEQIANETRMEIGSVEFNSESEGGIAGYAAFRAAAEAVTADDFPELVELDDGGVFALRLDGIAPPALRPFDEARAAVEADWTAAETHARILARAEEIKAQLDNGAPIDGLGLVTTRYDDFARGGFVSGAPEAVATAAFGLEAGTAGVVDADGQVFVVALETIHAAELAVPEVAEMHRTIALQAEQGMAQDLFGLYTQALQSEFGLTLNAAAINAVHSQLQ